MRHAVKLTKEEKVKIWLDLCDFSFRLMRSALSPKELRRKLKRIRELHWKEDQRMLTALGRIAR